MTFYGFCERGSLLHGTDPRARLGVCLAFILLAAFASSFQALCALLALALLLLRLAGIGLREVSLRLAGLNLFVAAVALTMPGSAGGFAVFDGFADGSLPWLLKMAIRCNAIMIAAAALASTVDMANFGHALAHFGLPAKLSHLLLFTVRQMETLRLEYLRLKDAMRARAFRPGCDLHTYKSLATLAAMLVLRSFDRAARVSEAMRCRNFNGRFHLVNHFKMRGGDWAFVSASAASLCALAALEFACRTR